MSVIEEISKLLKNGCDDDVLLNYIYENHNELECELNGDEFKEPKKHKRNFCIDCNLEMLIDYQESVLVCTNCGVFEYYPVYVSSYNHTMQPSRRKCIYKRSDNFKVILNQFLCIQNQKVPDEVIRTLWSQINNKDNLLYNYTIPITIPILECILKRNELTRYKDSIYFIYFKLSGVPFPHINTKEYNMMLKVFDVVSTIYDKYKPKGRKSFLNYPFVLKQILMMRNMDQYAKYIPKLKTHSKQKELEQLWFLITKDPEFAVALRKRKIS